MLINAAIFIGSLIGAYLLYILVKPKSAADLFFELHRDTEKECLLRRIEILEKRHRTTYPKERRAIEAYFQNGILSAEELENLEDIITRAFFNGFRKKWAVLRQADPVSAIVLVSVFLFGFFVAGFVLSTIKNDDPGVYQIVMGMIFSAIIFPLPYIFSLILLGLFSMLIAILRVFFKTKGSLLRASILCDEFIRALKPGGRSTAIVFPKTRKGFPGGPDFF